MKTVALRKKAKLSKERKKLNKLVKKRKKTTEKISKLQQKKKTKKTKVGKKLVEIRENLAKKKNTRIQKKINKNPEAQKDRLRGKMTEGLNVKGRPVRKKRGVPRDKTSVSEAMGRVQRKEQMKKKKMEAMKSTQTRKPRQKTNVELEMMRKKRTTRY